MLLMEENQQPAGWWSDLVDNNPPSGSIDGNYATSVTVHWVSGISYVNASCTTMTQMTFCLLYTSDAADESVPV